MSLILRNHTIVNLLKICTAFFIVLFYSFLKTSNIGACEPEADFSLFYMAEQWEQDEQLASEVRYAQVVDVITQQIGRYDPEYAGDLYKPEEEYKLLLTYIRFFSVLKKTSYTFLNEAHKEVLKQYYNKKSKKMEQKLGISCDGLIDGAIVFIFFSFAQLHQIGDDCLEKVKEDVKKRFSRYFKHKISSLLIDRDELFVNHETRCREIIKQYIVSLLPKISPYASEKVKHIVENNITQFTQEIDQMGPEKSNVDQGYTFNKLQRVTREIEQFSQHIVDEGVEKTARYITQKAYKKISLLKIPFDFIMNMIAYRMAQNGVSHIFLNMVRALISFDYQDTHKKVRKYKNYYVVYRSFVFHFLRKVYLFSNSTDRVKRIKMLRGNYIIENFFSLLFMEQYTTKMNWY